MTIKEETDRPLCVDLDGTLIATDLLWEATFALVGSRLRVVPRLLVWLLKGKAHFKRQVAMRVNFEPETLPYRPEVLDFLRRQKDAGRRLVLSTAADEHYARAVADHLAIFDEVIGSDERVNLKGPSKLQAIRERYGRVGFDYMGDSNADLPLWESSGRAYLVHPSHRLLKRARQVCSPEVFEDAGGSAKGLVKLLRMHQWAKNILILVPLLMAHQLTNLNLILSTLVGFVAFGLVASAGYVLNDLLDIQADRKHPTKRHRPLASGKVTIPVAAASCFLLLGSGMLASLALPLSFTGLLLLYFVLSVAYSVYLKEKVLVDVLCLAWLYTHRIAAGGAVTNLGVSTWLMAFSMFFFLSLAFVKRYVELSNVENSHTKLLRRGYLPTDLDLIRSMGPASGYLCVLVLCLYINGPDVLKLYRYPQSLWFVCPILLYWITRIWLLAHRKQLLDDPVLFALKDRTSFMAGAAIAVILILSS